MECGQQGQGQVELLHQSQESSQQPGRTLQEKEHQWAEVQHGPSSLVPDDHACISY